MAPPKVELNGKQPLEDVQEWAQKVGEMKLPPTAPPTVAVEKGTTVGGKRLMGNRRFKKLIIGFFIGAFIATGITVGVFMATRHHGHHHWRGHVENHRGHHAEEDIRTEGSKRVIYVARNATSHFFRMLAVLDYGTQLAGFLDSGKNRCYVDRLRESYENGCNRWRHYESHSRRPDRRPLRVGPVIDQDVLRYIAGDEIAGVCANNPAHWVLEIAAGAPQDPNAEIIYL